MRTSYIILLRGINVGGKNKVPMANLKQCLQDGGYANVQTYIASGNVLLDSNESPEKIKSDVESMLADNFTLDSELIKVLVLTPQALKNIIDKKPKGFGEKPDTYHSDVVFLMDIEPERTAALFDPREGVDSLWCRNDVIYFRRLSAQRAKSRFSKIISNPAYRSMTIRNWNTTTKLHELMQERQKK